MIKWMRKASKTTSRKGSESPRKMKDLSTTMSIRHAPFDAEHHFEVDGGFLDKLRLKKDHEHPDPMDRFKQPRKSLWRDPFFHEDDESGSHVSQNLSQAKDETSKADTPPPRARPLSTFQRISAMITRPFTKKVPPPPPPPRLPGSVPMRNRRSDSFGDEDYSVYEIEEDGAVKRKSSLKPKENLQVPKRISSRKKPVPPTPPPGLSVPPVAEPPSRNGGSAKSVLASHMKDRRKMIAESTTSDFSVHMSTSEQPSKPPPSSSAPTTKAKTDGRSAMLAMIQARRKSSFKPPAPPSPVDAVPKPSSVVIPKRKSSRKYIPPPPPAVEKPSAGLESVDDADLAKYKMMLKAGLPEGAVYQKMMLEGVDPALIGLSF